MWRLFGRLKMKHLSEQVAMLYQEGKYEEAIPLATQTCDLARKRLGEEHPDYATSLSNLALLRRVMGNYTAAEPFYRQTSDIRRKAVGESYTFDILVESAEPFRMAMTLLDEYYPSIVFSRGDRATNSTSALLHLTVTGRQSTDGLGAVCDWPEPGVCWPEGVAPVSVAIGVRFTGGGLAAERLNISILIP